MQAFLELKDLYHSYGPLPALQGLSFQVPKFSTCAFIGANGAGKTTTFSLICGFIRLRKGNIHIAGQSWSQYRKAGHAIGVLPQDVDYFERRSIFRQLMLFAKLSGLTSKQSAQAVDKVLHQVKLSERADDLVHALSRGMKVRLGIAQALLGEPELILLDEPTAGLDPLMLIEFRELIHSIQGKTTLLISSHDLSELQAICDYVCIIDRGKLMRQGSLQEMLGSVSMVRIKIDPHGADLKELQSNMPHTSINLENRETLIVEFDANQHRLPEINKNVLGWLLEKGVPILAVEEPKKSLEQAYIEETKSSNKDKPKQ